ncbi:carbohydrate kinase [Rhizobium bangladeshense]|uniref:Carbohydrate kinase n=1 Tax=Rhizobium bangladeshense TaxID=1138189 RepID=A0ABS7LRJ4_9HYPH|nr:carbohydrate kinase family protein [Rhizobium bangladeshense]MBX4867804.1 carbohydrate kinase [Rhizobium bangladeshense]MBX4875093.1 carbohydrate kinase [Rhizobium bangladeshense]MBX4886006.1 carbohydrate kinase [Rhizobium bangladeshense]MBY3593769.1 carbohydrate kinase [Rhizobium bangladeshense]QSY96389.1 carbohydrate kinase family protein [Rhizobium bangladeshense]
MMKKILVLGGAHIDRRGRISGETAPGASNPGTWFEEPGGGGFNAARNLARLGFHVTMISPRGGDPFGEMVGEAADFAGIDDRPFVFLDRKTPSYTAIIEKTGDLVIALADMDLYRFFVPRRLSIRWVREAFAAHDCILVDANLPEETITAIVAKAHSLDKPVVAIAISPAKVVRLKPSIKDIEYLFLNEAEATALVGQQPQDAAGWAPLLKAIGIRSAVVTRGQRELVAIREGCVATLQPPVADAVADVTGAGDSLAAGTLAALITGLPLEEAVRYGAAAAALTVQSRHAVNENLTADGLNEALALVPVARILH